MLSGSAFLRVIVLLAAAAVLAGVAQHYLVRPGDTPEPPRADAARPAPGPRAPPRTVPSTPQPSPPPARPEPAPPTESAQAMPTPAAPRDAAPPESAPDQALAQPPDDDVPLAGEAPQPGPTEAVAEPTGDLVDLNTGTQAQLNGLKGGGAIGRAIIQRRPYSSVDQLLSKRVLSRSTFQRIKDQVTVR